MYRKRFYGKVFKWVGKAAYGLRFISLRYFNAAGAHVSGKIGEAHQWWRKQYFQSWKWSWIHSERSY